MPVTRQGLDDALGFGLAVSFVFSWGLIRVTWAGGKAG